MTVQNICALLATPTPIANEVYHVLGYYKPGDGGGGDFYWDATSNETPDYGTIFDTDTNAVCETQTISPNLTGRWKRLYNEPVNVKWFGARGNWNGTSGNDDVLYFQRAFSFLAATHTDTLYVPAGRYLFNSAVTLPSFLTLIGDSNGAAGLYPTLLVANNNTAVFTAASMQSVSIKSIGFTAVGAGKGVAYAYKQSNLTLYSARCLFDNCNIWSDMAGGFYGNFILTKWINCIFGYLGNTKPTSFLPIYSKGNISALQSNANTVEGCYILHSGGSDTIYFEAGTDLVIRECRFESCFADATIRCLGIAKVNISDCYFENCNGIGTLYPIILSNDSTNATSCYAVSITGSYAQLSPNNLSFVRMLGAVGGIIFNNNRLTNLDNKNISSGIGGDNKGFSCFAGNRISGTPSSSYPKQGQIFPEEGTWTPELKFTSGTSNNIYEIQSGTYTRSGNMITASFKVKVTTVDTARAGVAYILLNNLPAAKTVTHEAYSGSIYNYSGVTLQTGFTQLGIGVASGTPNLHFMQNGSGSPALLLPAAGCVNGFSITGTIIYQV
ncbi:Pectate lyase superfamily protein [Chitinophaga terrae (ex Kim and Jung 2007)]|uniref:Pectate lyase superfamily protein n=1 Tax=Chitinophaga terrae (ex Kim and Jung 2007) TaxID=408074 RepID=A0A1H4ERR9_9BACT|nr:glycosyl hydrolase family 28-related protein [Chitinophaga terrae (ex Kim and Jung 2007)]GEP91800.1 hypothetical protein CTE07_34450 [Chitinophaga terrae (ex Kim and Jung 2007)]SEA87755.1 Pectate lyase superfamily protein [Chitinophaga terrae (ex Kim and Jung 2007)]